MTAIQIASHAPLFSHYSLFSAYDEAFDAHGAPRAHYRGRGEDVGAD